MQRGAVMRQALVHNGEVWRLTRHGPAFRAR
jgi:hypothetical protein